MTLKILIIALDKELLNKDSVVTRRMNLYNKVAKAESHIILHTKNPHKQVQHDTVHVYPTNSRSRTTFIFDALKQAKKIIEEEKPDLITTQDPHITGIVGALLRKKYRIPYCVHIHSDCINNKEWIRNRPLHRIFHLASKYVLPRADGFRVVSTKIRDALIKKNIPQENIQVVSTPVNLEYFFKEDKQATNAFKKKHSLQGTNILFVGRFVEPKNLFFLVNTFKEIKDTNVHLLLAGSGPLEKPLKQHIKNHSIERVRFIGKLDMKELKAAYYATEFTVLSSVFEGTAKVLKEASACGKAFLTTNVSGTKDLVKHNESAYIVPINDKEKYLKGLNKLIKDKKYRKQLGVNAKKAIKRSDTELQGAKKVADIWNKTAKKKPLK